MATDAIPTESAEPVITIENSDVPAGDATKKADDSDVPN